MKRANIWTVSDTDRQNFPTDGNDLKRRLAAIERWIPKQPGNNNIQFVKAAFTLIKDLGIISKTLVESLSDWTWCRDVFGCAMNPMPTGGVLRREGMSMWSSSNLRYYCPYSQLRVAGDIEDANRKKWTSETKLAVIFEGVTYYISNNWFDDENRQQKKIFYNWLSAVAWQICKIGWGTK